jgi:hypothetical protein
VSAHLPPNHDNRPHFWLTDGDSLSLTAPHYTEALEVNCFDTRRDPKHPLGGRALVVMPDGKVIIDWANIKICAALPIPKSGYISEEQAFALALLAAHGDKP